MHALTSASACPALPAPAVDGVVSVAEATADLWHHGVAVVQAAHAVTGLPMVAADQVAAYVQERQRRALGVWLASVTDPSGSVIVGHAVLTPVAADHAGWSQVEDPHVREALTAGRLVELGGLAVAPGWTRLGAAEALVTARLGWLAERGLVGCSSVWRASAGSTRLAERYGRRVQAASSVAWDRFVYLPRN